MKKETMQKILQSPISRADIKFKTGNIIKFGFDVHIIAYSEIYFETVGCTVGQNEQFAYSKVKSIDVFE